MSKQNGTTDTVSELKIKLRELELPQSGKKLELKERLRVHQGNLLASVTLAKIKESKRRKEGTDFTLEGKQHELERIFGLRGRSSRHEEFRDFEQKVYSKNPSELTECLVDSELSVNLKICNWCIQRNICANKENRNLKSTDTIEIRSRQMERHKDAEVLEDWFSEGSFVSTKISKCLVFTDPSDPFKPGFGRISDNRKLLLVPMNEIAQINLGDEHNWSHLFYSKYLRKTISVFEALCLNAMTQWKMTLEKGQSMDFPTLRQIQTFFKNLMGPIALNFSKVQLQKRLFESFFSDTELEENVLLDQLLRNTNQYFDSKLFDNKLEIFSTSKISIELVQTMDKMNNPMFIDLLTEFLYDVLQKTKLYKTKDDLKDVFFEERIQCQILTPKGLANLQIPVQYQTLRIMEIEKLAQTWILIDSDKFPKTEKNSAPFHKYPEKWTAKYEIPSQLKNHMLENVDSEYKMANWDEIKQATKISDVIVFQPSNIFSANSMSLLLNKYSNSSGDKHSTKTLESFDSIMKLVFFNPAKRMHSNAKLASDLLDLKQEFDRPDYRRLNPLDCLKEISKNSKFKRFISYQDDPDEDDDIIGKVTMQIKLETPGYFERGNDEEKDKHKPLSWVYRKITEKNTLDNRNADVNFHDWEPYRIEGREVVLNKKNIERFKELLQTRSSINKEEVYQSKYLWCSPNVHSLLQDEDHPSKVDEMSILSSFIRNLINHEGTFGTVMVATESERAHIERLVGRQRFRTISDLISGQTIITWLPSAMISDFSPNFLHVGKIN